ncbi:MAG: hypothetical protein ABT15_09190 [Pseudonocardia sp. SCN 73-27]|nr:MAG: hypothetical protein ABT15_09190 [Pseudonocardia sp. SCN 73-27]
MGHATTSRSSHLVDHTEGVRRDCDLDVSHRWPPDGDERAPGTAERSTKIGCLGVIQVIADVL